MTIAELRNKPEGVIETGYITVQDGVKLDYYLGKGFDITGKPKYFMDFSPYGNYCIHKLSEKDFLALVNNPRLAIQEAVWIYMESPHLSANL